MVAKPFEVVLFLSVILLPAVLGHACFGHRMKPCRSGHCIASELFCNGDNDCGDWSDELNCNVETGHAKCLSNMFHCGAHPLCIPLTWLCDGLTDCPDGRDELNCSVASECKTGFKCGKECIPNSWVCDGIADCLDRSDEKDCPSIKTLDDELDSFAEKIAANAIQDAKTGNGTVYTRQTSQILPFVLQTLHQAMKRIQEAVDNPCVPNPCKSGLCAAENATSYACYCPRGLTVSSLQPFTCE